MSHEPKDRAHAIKFESYVYRDSNGQIIAELRYSSICSGSNSVSMTKLNELASECYQYLESVNAKLISSEVRGSSSYDGDVDLFLEIAGQRLPTEDEVIELLKREEVAKERELAIKQAQFDRLKLELGIK